MKRIIIGGLAALALSACGTSPQQLCKDMITASCNKIYTCNTGATLDAIKGIYGATEADCVTKLGATSCDTVTDSKPCSDTSKTYDASKASACVADYKAETCDQVVAGTTPTSCSQVCK
jgi:hypothetical protein